MKRLSSLLKIAVSFILLLLHLNASGGDPYRPSAGAGEAGMGFSCVMKNSFWSSFHNQAILAVNNSYSAGFSYENRFGINELGTKTAGAVIPVWKASVGALYSNFGYTGFKREMAGLATGIKLSEWLCAGIQVDYFSEKTLNDYANSQYVTFETGILILPSENIRIGVHLFNPVPNSLRNSYLPSVLRVGTGIYISQSLFAGAEAEINTENRFVVRTGFEYEAAKKILLRGGFSTENNSFSFGVGYMVRKVQIDLGFNTHEKLGITSSVSLVFKIH